jgi:hypothetical protein
VVLLNLHPDFLFFPEPVDASAGTTIISRKIARKKDIKYLDNRQHIPFIDLLCFRDAVPVSSGVIQLNVFMTFTGLLSYT